MTSLYKDRWSVFKLGLLLSVLLLSSTAQKQGYENNADESIYNFLCGSIDPDEDAEIIFFPPSVTIGPDKTVPVNVRVVLMDENRPITWQPLEENISWLDGKIVPSEGTPTQLTLMSSEAIPPRDPCPSHLRVPLEAGRCNPKEYFLVEVNGWVDGTPDEDASRTLPVIGLAPRLVIEKPDLSFGEETTVKVFVENAAATAWDFDAELKSFSLPDKSRVTTILPSLADSAEVTILGGMLSTADRNAQCDELNGFCWILEYLKVTATSGDQTLTLTAPIRLYFPLSGE